MNKLLFYYIIIALLFFACKSNKSNEFKNNVISNKNIELQKADTLYSIFNDYTSFVKENSKTTIDIIKANFKRINKIKNWQKIDTIEFFDQSTEGGVVVKY